MDPLRDMRIAEGEIVSGVRLDRRAAGRPAVGDVIEVAFGTKAVKVRVTSVQETIRKEDTKEMFEYI